MSLKNRITSIVNKLIATSRNIYHKSPGLIRWILWPGRLIYRLIYKFIRIFRLDMWIIVGSEKASGQELILAFAGLQVNKNYLVGLAFDNSYKEEYIGKKWLWELIKVVKKCKYDPSILIFNVPYSFRIFSQRMRCIYVPCWINGEIDLSSDYSSLFKNKNSSLKSDISKIKKNKLNYEVTHDSSQLYNFYYNMHLKEVWVL